MTKAAPTPEPTLYRKLAGEDSPVAVSWGMLAFRWWGVLMLALTYWKTYKAWGPRPDDFPPLLPLWEGSPALPQFDLFWPLLLTLALVPFVARLGLILHSITLFYAIITDLTRIQPECFSPVILLWATLPSDNAKTIARAHLAAMWFFAGFHKLMAPAFQLHVGPEIFTHLFQFKNLDKDIAYWLGITTAIVEMSVGLGVMLPPTRRIAAIAAIGMHFVIFIASTHGIPIGIEQLWNGDWDGARRSFNPNSWYEPVWPWNLLLMWAGLAFFWNDHSWPLTAWKKMTWPIRTAVAVLLISPIGYYFGLVNPYLANCIYTGNFIRGFRLPANPRVLAPSNGDANSNLNIPKDPPSLGSETSRDLGISLPPSERMFQRFFAKTGKLHERMILHYPGWMAMYTGIKERELWLGHGEKINGVQVGHWIYYHDNGAKSDEGEYVQGAQTGHWIIYDEAGRKAQEGPFLNGIQTGHWIRWRKDGTKDSEGEMRNNLTHGKWVLYFEDGRKEEAFFVNGQRID